MTLTKFMARSTWVAHAFEWEKLLKCHLKGKASKKLANGQNIDYSEKRKRPKGFICPCTGVKYHNIQTCLLVYAADSGERLQDHWSSGLTFRCCCGRPETWQGHVPQSLNVHSDERWHPYRHTEAKPTDAYGCIEFQGAPHPSKAQVRKVLLSIY